MGCGASSGTYQTSSRVDDRHLTVVVQPSLAEDKIVTIRPETPEYNLVPPIDLEGPTDDPFFNQALWLHNAYRSRHHAPQLRHSLELTEYARHWAETMAKNDSFEYSNGVLDSQRVGENIYETETREMTAKTVCDAWYNEKKEHDFSSDDFIIQSGHFTQMIWYDSREFGIARVRGDGGKTYVVANYKPPGNVQGEFRKNVFDIED